MALRGKGQGRRASQQPGVKHFVDRPTERQKTKRTAELGVRAGKKEGGERERGGGLRAENTKRPPTKPLKSRKMGVPNSRKRNKLAHWKNAVVTTAHSWGKRKITSASSFGELTTRGQKEELRGTGYVCGKVTNTPVREKQKGRTRRNTRIGGEPVDG